MEVLFIDVTYDTEDEFNISVYGDLHDEAHHTDSKALRKHMDVRAALPNSRFIGLGDMGDWILPRDNRYMISTVEGGRPANGYDDWIDRELATKMDHWKKYPWDFVAMGNHEFQALRRYYTNPAERLCQMLETRYGGYAGFARYRFITTSDQKVRHNLTFLYHHGAWGGRVIKGFGGARDYARMFEGWDIMIFGHNHQSVVHQEAVTTTNSRGRLCKRQRFFVNTGTWMDTYTQGGTPSYGERGGYPPAALASPLITVRPTKRKLNIQISVDNQ